MQALDPAPPITHTIKSNQQGIFSKIVLFSRPSNPDKGEDTPMKARYVVSAALALLLVLSTGCGTIYTIEPETGPYAHMTAPVLAELRLMGRL